MSKSKNNAINNIESSADNINVNMEATTNSLTQIKYEKTSCYYCNDWLDPQSFKEHLIHCGQILEQCPNNCSTFVQRKRMRSHLLDCSVGKKTTTQNGHIDDVDEYQNRIEVLEQDITSLRKVLNEEIKERLHLITDVGSLRKHNQISDEWTHKVGDVLGNIKKCLNEESNLRNGELQKCNENIDKLFLQSQDVHGWQMFVADRLDQFERTLFENQSAKQSMVITNSESCQALESIENLRIEVNTIKSEISEIAMEVNKTFQHLTENFIKLQSRLERSMQIEWDNRKKLETIVNSIQSDLKSKFIENTEISTKQMTLSCEVKGMKNIVCETEEKCDKLEKILNESNKLLYKTKQELFQLEEHLMYQKQLSGIHNTRGNLIWKIENYSAKLIEAKEFDVILNSPIFCNRQYGYNLRLDVHLNGIGSWRGRNLIACITVVPGEYDSLLNWPCKLEADIILRDQPKKIQLAEDYIRTTVVKKKSEEPTTDQCIHIPHKIIESRNYIRKGAIILEVRIHRSKYVQ